MRITVVGLPWYRKEHYTQLRGLFVDGMRLHETYAAWLEAARATERHLVERGYRVVRVEILPEEFMAWCSVHERVPNAHSRTGYASETAYADKRMDEARDEVVLRARQTADLVERHVTPVFAHRSDAQLDFEGSGIFVRLDGACYVVTAAHVLDACEYGCVVRAEADSGQPLSGTFIVTGRPGGSRDADVFDIGFVRLTAAEIVGIGPDSFLDLTETLDTLPEPDDPMIALGFAASDQRVDREIVQTKLTTFVTGLESQHAYRVAGTNPRSHLLVRYRRKVMVYNGRYHGSAPSLKGMSGGGIWQVSLLEPMRVSTTPALAAVVIERAEKYQAAIVATRAAVVRSFIRKVDVAPAP